MQKNLKISDATSVVLRVIVALHRSRKKTIISKIFCSTYFGAKNIVPHIVCPIVLHWTGSSCRSTISRTFPLNKAKICVYGLGTTQSPKGTRLKAA